MKKLKKGQYKLLAQARKLPMMSRFIKAFNDIVLSGPGRPKIPQTKLEAKLKMKAARKKMSDKNAKRLNCEY